MVGGAWSVDPVQGQEGLIYIHLLASIHPKSGHLLGRLNPIIKGMLFSAPLFCVVLK